jgi:hypothetical protein
MFPGPRRTVLALFAAAVACLCMLLSLGLSASLVERDTGPLIGNLELVSYPAAEVLSVAVTPSATLAEAHDLLNLIETNTSPAPLILTRYESASSGVGRRQALDRGPYSLQAILDAHRAPRSSPLRC